MTPITVSNDALRGANPQAAAQVMQWVSFADSEIVPPASAWVFPTLGIMQFNKQVRGIQRVWNHKGCNLLWCEQHKALQWQVNVLTSWMDWFTSNESPSGFAAGVGSSVQIIQWTRQVRLVCCCRSSALYNEFTATNVWTLFECSCWCFLLAVDTNYIVSARTLLY